MDWAGLVKLTILHWLCSFCKPCNLIGVKSNIIKNIGEHLSYLDLYQN